jgi:hypothetical protein
MKKALVLIGALMVLSVAVGAYAAGHVVPGKIVGEGTVTKIEGAALDSIKDILEITGDSVKPILDTVPTVITDYQDVAAGLAVALKVPDGVEVTPSVVPLRGLEVSNIELSEALEDPSKVAGIYPVGINNADFGALALNNGTFGLYLLSRDKTKVQPIAYAYPEDEDEDEDTPKYAFVGENKGEVSAVPTATHTRLVLEITEGVVKDYAYSGSVVFHTFAASQSETVSGGSGGCSVGLPSLAILALAAGAAFMLKKGKSSR